MSVDTEQPARPQALIGAALLAAGRPVRLRELAGVLGLGEDATLRAVQAFAAALEAAGLGITLEAVAGGYRLIVPPGLAGHLAPLLAPAPLPSLSNAALEVLAVIAYRQPVTRARVAAVRGVNVDGVIRTLVARGMIVECGNDADTGGLLYRTTELFLERLGLASLDELPDIAPLLPDVDLVDEMSDDPADDPRIPVGRRRRTGETTVEPAGGETGGPEDGFATEHHDEEM